jgi:hypothetical protein
MNHEHSVQKGEATTTEEQREIAIKVLYVWRRFTTGSWRYRKRGEVKGAIARRRKGGTKIKRRLKGGKQEGRTKTYLKKETYYNVKRDLLLHTLQEGRTKTYLTSILLLACYACILLLI